jgi:hypothetical protein
VPFLSHSYSSIRFKSNTSGRITFRGAEQSSQASAHEDCCRLCDGVSRLQRAAGLRIDAPTSLNPTQTQYSRSTDCRASTDARDCSYRGSVRISKGPHHAQA